MPAQVWHGENEHSAVEVKEVDSSEKATVEVDGSRDVKPELIVFEGTLVRHELLAEESAKEAVGSHIPVELEAPRTAKS